MSFLLSLLPYVAFFAVMRTVSVAAGLWAAFAVGLANLLLLRRLRRPVMLLQAGTLVLFAALAVFTAVTHWPWTMTEIRLAMDAGFLAIILVSLAADRPFTMEYARRRVPAAFWGTPLFMTVNRHITWAWAAAFALLTASTCADLLRPAIPIWFDGLVGLATMAATIRFTTWYPRFARRRAGDPWAKTMPPSDGNYRPAAGRFR